MVQDVDVEIPPGDFGDPGSQAFLVAAGALRLPAGYQALPARENTVGEIRGYLAGAIDGGEVTLFLVRTAAFFEEALELVVGGIFTGCNEGLGGVSKGFGYGVDLFRAYGVTPGFGRWEETRMGFFYPAAPASRKASGMESICSGLTALPLALGVGKRPGWVSSIQLRQRLENGVNTE